jgi:hypothetical protein
MRGPWARAAAIAFLYAAGARAETAASSGLRVENAGCPEAIVPGLAAGVKLEIEVLMRERGPVGASPDRITIGCDESAARIAVTMAGAHRESTVDLGALAPEHRARALALATAELVHAMDGTSAAEAPPTATPAAQPTVGPPVERRPAALEPTPLATRARPELLAGGLAEWLGNPTALLFGARVAVRAPLGRFVVPALSVDGSLGSLPVPSAEVAVETVTAGVHLYVGTTIGRLRFDVGPGTRWGWVHVTGRPVAGATLEGGSVTAVCGGPELRARVGYARTEHRFPVLAVEVGAGVVARPMRGLRDGTERVYAVEGTWVSLSAALGFGL